MFVVMERVRNLLLFELDLGSITGIRTTTLSGQGTNASSLLF